MLDDYLYKKAQVKDLDRFFLFFVRSIRKQFPQYTPKTRDYFLKRIYSQKVLKRQLQDKEIMIYLALDQKKVVGYLMVLPLLGGICLGVWLAVSESYQRKGIASKLLEIWEKDARGLGIHKLHLWTDQKNLEFYKRRGFRLVGKIPQNFYGVDDYLFYKSIQKPQEKNFLKSAS